MKVSVRKISEITGFSPATVSNALNRKRGVNKETAERILAVAEEMGYVGENRITKIKFVIFRRSGSIIDDSAFHPAVIEGVERCAKEMGYETVFCNLNSNDAEYEERVREILSDTSGAVVLLGTEMLDEDYELYENAKCRIILLDGWNDEGKFDGILIDNTDSACRAMEYLVRKGHREIGYLQGDFRIKAFQYRRYGFERVCQKYNLPMDLEYTVTLGTQIETAYQDMRRYLKKNRNFQPHILRKMM